MANWTHNGPCSSCGSRDNLGTWDDGSTYCWGCGASSKRTKLPRIQEEEPPTHKPLPDDAGHNFTPASVAWLQQFGLSLPDAIRWNIVCSPSRNQTIFTFPDTDLWQARNHEPSRVKYFTSGNHDNILPLYNGEIESNTCVLTEDCLSAIRVVGASSSQASARGLDGATRASMPLLGTSLPKSKLVALRGCFSKLVFWLDSDKLNMSMKHAQQAKLLGFTTSVVYSPLDPKEYSNEEIMEFLK